MKFQIAMLAAVTALTVGTAAMAQTTVSATDKATWPTYACRVPMKGDTANTTMGTTQMYCAKIDYAKARATIMKMVQDAMANGTQPTQAQIDAAYQKAYGNQNLLGVFH
jgi:hypothetical protein